MFKKNLYKYKNEDGKTIISFYEPECEHEPLIRLISQSEDYLLTDYNVYVSCIDIPLIDEQLWFEVHKDDLNTPVSQIEDMLSSMQTLEESQVVQDEVIDITLCALDEMFMMISGETSQIFSARMGNSGMVEMYVVMVQRGLKTIEQVPERYREEVTMLLLKSSLY